MAYDEKIRIGIDNREAIRGIDQLSKKLRGVEGMGKINARNFTQPLGQITGKANEFTKSMEAANARVLAFGAAAGTIYQVQRAFQALVTSTIEVEYSLKRINTLLKQTASSQAKTSSELFRIAKETGQSFDETAKAMEEFARQGLDAATSAKRTRDAMILVRLSGMDATSAVMGLTAAINGFNKVGLDSTTILNKMSTVAAKFAVSERDLAEAVKRVGSAAVDARVSFDELMGAVAAAQQITARGGSVIGNSFKTIFTRIQRLRNVRALEEIGVKVRDMNQNMLPAMQILKNLAGEFDNLKDAEKAQVSELIGGVFQINVLKAVMKDLANANGLAARATKISTNATNEAIVKNKELNDTLKAMMNETMANFVQMSAKIGKLTLEKPAKNIMKIFNTMFKAVTPGDAEGFGTKMGKGILKGLGDFLGGPGLVLVAGVIGKLMAKFTMFAVDSIKSMTAQGKALERRALLEREIIQLLTKDTALVNMLEKEHIDIEKVQGRVLGLIQSQVAATKTLALVSAQVAPVVAGRGFGARASGGITKTGTGTGISAGGFVPRPDKLAERAGAFAGGYTPGRVTSMHIPRFGKLVYNTNETVAQFPGFAQPAVMPPKGSPAAGSYKQTFQRAHGFNPYTPNFAAQATIAGLPAATYGKAQEKAIARRQDKMGRGSMMVDGSKIRMRGFGSSKKPAISMPTAKGSVIIGEGGTAPSAITSMFTSMPALSQRADIKAATAGKFPVKLPDGATAMGFKMPGVYGQLTGIKSRGVKGQEKAWLGQSNDGAFKDELDYIHNGLAGYASRISQEIFGSEFKVTKQELKGAGGMMNLLGNDFKGNLFEGAIRGALNTKRLKKDMLEGHDSYMDFNEMSAADPQLLKFMGMPKGSKVEAKISQASITGEPMKFNRKFISDNLVKPTPNQVSSQIMKLYQQRVRENAANMPRRRAAGGFIPNFADPNRMREAQQAGVSYGQTYYAHVDAPNFAGTVVGNRRDEPTPGALKQAVNNHPNPAMAGLASRGFVPNFYAGTGQGMPVTAQSSMLMGAHLFSPSELKALSARELAALASDPRFASNPSVAAEVAKRNRFSMGIGRASVSAAQSRVGGHAVGGFMRAAGGVDKAMMKMGPMGGMMLGMGAPMLGNMISEGIGRRTQAQRGGGAIAEGLGRGVGYGAFAHTLLGGGLGAAEAAGATLPASAKITQAGGAAGRGLLGRVGAGALAGAKGPPQMAAVGALVVGLGTLAAEVPSIVRGFTEMMPEFEDSLKRAIESSQNYASAMNSLLEIQNKLVKSAQDLTDAEKKLLEKQERTQLQKLDTETRTAYEAAASPLERSLALQEGKDRRDAMTAAKRARTGLSAISDSTDEFGEYLGGTERRKSLFKGQGGKAGFGISSSNMFKASNLKGAGVELVREIMTSPAIEALAIMPEEVRTEMAKRMSGFSSTIKDMGDDQIEEELRKIFTLPQGLKDKEGKSIKYNQAQRNVMDSLRQGAMQAPHQMNLKGDVGDNRRIRGLLNEFIGKLRQNLEGGDTAAPFQEKRNTAIKKANDKIEKTTIALFDLSRSIEEVMVRMQMNIDTFSISLKDLSQTTNDVTSAFLKRAELMGAGPESMANLGFRANVANLDAQFGGGRKLQEAKIQQSMIAGVAKGSLEGFQKALTKYGGQVAQPKGEERFLQAVQQFAEMGHGMREIAEAFEKGGVQGGLDAANKVIEKLDDIAQKATVTAVEGGQQKNKEVADQAKKTMGVLITEINKYRIALNKLNGEMFVAAKGALRRYDIELNLNRLRRKMTVGGGIEGVLGKGQTDLGDKMNAIRLGYQTAPGTVGRAQAGMQYGDLITKYGAEIPDNLRKQITEGLAEQMKRDFATLGLSEPTGGFRDLASKQVDNRYKSENLMGKMVEELSTLTTSLDQWVQDPHVSVDNWDGIEGKLFRVEGKRSPVEISGKEAGGIELKGNNLGENINKGLQGTKSVGEAVGKLMKMKSTVSGRREGLSAKIASQKAQIGQLDEIRPHGEAAIAGMREKAANIQRTIDTGGQVGGTPASMRAFAGVTVAQGRLGSAEQALADHKEKAAALAKKQADMEEARLKVVAVHNKKYKEAEEKVVQTLNAVKHGWVHGVKGPEGKGPGSGNTRENQALVERAKSGKVFAGTPATRQGYTKAMELVDKAISARQNLELLKTERQDLSTGSIGGLGGATDFHRRNPMWYHTRYGSKGVGGASSRALAQQARSSAEALRLNDPTKFKPAAEVQAGFDRLQHDWDPDPRGPDAQGMARVVNVEDVLADKVEEARAALGKALEAQVQAGKELAKLKQNELSKAQFALLQLNSNDKKRAEHQAEVTRLEGELVKLKKEETVLASIASSVQESPLDQKVVRNMLTNMDPMARMSRAGAIAGLSKGRALDAASVTPEGLAAFEFDLKERKRVPDFPHGPIQGPLAHDEQKIQNDFRAYMQNIRSTVGRAEQTPFRDQFFRQTKAAGATTLATSGVGMGTYDSALAEFTKSIEDIKAQNLSMVETQKLVTVAQRELVYSIDRDLRPQTITLSRAMQDLANDVTSGALGGGARSVGGRMIDIMKGDDYGSMMRNQANATNQNILSQLMPRSTVADMEYFRESLSGLAEEALKSGDTWAQVMEQMKQKANEFTMALNYQDYLAGRSAKPDIAGGIGASIYSKGGTTLQQMLYGTNTSMEGVAGGQFVPGMQQALFGQTTQGRQSNFLSTMQGQAGFAGQITDVFGADSPQAKELMFSLQELGKSYMDGSMSQMEVNMRLQAVKNSIEQGMLAENLEIAGKLYEEGNMTAEEYINAMGDAAKRMRAGKEYGFGVGMKKGFSFTKDEEARFKETAGQQSAEEFKANLGDAFKSMIDGSKSVKEAFRDFGMAMIQGLSDKAVDYFINKAFAGLGFEDKAKDKSAMVLDGAASTMQAAASGFATSMQSASTTVQGAANTMQGTVATQQSAAGTMTTAAATMLQAAQMMMMKPGTAIATGGLITPRGVKRFNRGGPVIGGSGSKDDVPAMMRSGEFVIRKGSVQRYGSEFMENLNRGVVGMAKGGRVGEQAVGGDASAAAFKAQYLDGMGPVIKNMSYVDLKRHAQSKYGKGRSSGWRNKALGGVLMAATIGMGLYGAMNQPDAEEIKSSQGAGAAALGSQDLSETEFRRGFAARTATKIQRLEKGINSVAANAAVMEGSDPRRPTGIREITALGSTHSALAYGGGGAQKTAMDDMRENRMKAFDAFAKGQQGIRDKYEEAKKAHKRQKRGVLTQGIMSAAFTMAMGAGGGEKAPTDETSTPHEDPNMAGHNVFGEPSGGGLYDGVTKALGGRMHRDNIPALLMGGEYVINKRAVDSIGVPALNAINRGTYSPKVRRYAQGGYVAPDTGAPAPMSNLGGSEETLAQLRDLVTATDSVREAIESLGAVMTQPTMQGQNLEAGTVGAAVGGQTNNISINVNVEGGSRQAASSTTDDAGNEEGGKKENIQEMEGFAELLEVAVMKVIMEQKRPGGLLYDPQNRSNF